MEKDDQLQEFDLDDILSEFGSPEEAPLPDTGDLAQLEALVTEADGGEAPEEDEVRPMELLEIPGQEEPEPLPTLRLDPLPQSEETSGEAVREDIPAEGSTVDQLIEALSAEAPQEEPAPEPVKHIPFNPRAKLRETKKKLVAGPEKRYYALSEIGLGRLQLALIASILVVALSGAAAAMHGFGLVGENRLRFVIFSQVLAMMTSALLGSQLMVDSVADLFRGRFTINTLLTFAFFACLADAVFSLRDLRVPCCGAFSLEMTLALWARYQQRSTEMSQMDTMRKAVRFRSLGKVPGYYEGKAGILQGEGDVEDFMDTYDRPSGPETARSIYAGVSLLLSIAIGVLGYLRHGTATGVQFLAASLLVSVPASFFVACTRPMAILQKRLHMVGAVLCGWQGVKGLKGKAAFPLRDEDIFPQGSAKFNGVKYYSDRDSDETLAFAASLMAASGSGLTPAFRQMLSGKGGQEFPVEKFRTYGTQGIGGLVQGEPVLLGSLDLLQDLGVDIPEGTMVNQAIYCAIDGRLCAVFAIAYTKMRYAAAGLVILCGSRKLTPVVIGNDFMIDSGLLRAKFNVSTRRMAFPEPEQRRELRQTSLPEDAPALALTTRDDLACAAYCVCGAQALRRSTLLGTWLHLIAGVLGLVSMAALAYLGSTQLLTPLHMLSWQLVWMLPGLLITEGTRRV